MQCTAVSPEFVPPIGCLQAKVCAQRILGRSHCHLSTCEGVPIRKRLSSATRQPGTGAILLHQHLHHCATSLWTSSISLLPCFGLSLSWRGLYVLVTSRTAFWEVTIIHHFQLLTVCLAWTISVAQRTARIPGRRRSQWRHKGRVYAQWTLLELVLQEWHQQNELLERPLH
ncbi:hypothetical protein BDV96DRAFT_168095 [Lophiotrema nucula]|uniref:Uncharacterized protein n=1 Tax=Lophiotrema nucula TaxID=690887 RepID=A0A6A5Z140_9PLEO|nr:hypothetical protein BDV96DRAFT_168095 [Lophiotrema nucula]